MTILRSTVVGLLDRNYTRPLLAKLSSMAGWRSGLRFYYDGVFWLYVADGMALPRSRTFSFYRWDVDHLAERVAAFQQETQDYWFFRYRPKVGDTIVDVGAEIGTDAVVFSRSVGTTGRVIAIEAVPETYRMLLSTIRANKLANVVPIPKAVSDKPGLIRISTDKSAEANFISDTGELVESDTLDNMLAQYERIDLLKMNIEGAERLAINGMDRTINKTRHIAIACHDFVANEKRNEWFRTKDLVCSYLTSRGFTYVIRSDDPREYVRWHVHASRT